MICESLLEISPLCLETNINLNYKRKDHESMLKKIVVGETGRDNQAFSRIQQMGGLKQCFLICSRDSCSCSMLL